MFLLGGMTVALTTGLLNVLVFHADALKTQATVSAGVDLALGLLLAARGLTPTRRLHGRRKVPVRAGDGRSGRKDKKDGWAQRVLSEPGSGSPCWPAR